MVYQNPAHHININSEKSVAIHPILLTIEHIQLDTRPPKNQQNYTQLNHKNRPIADSP